MYLDVPVCKQQVDDDVDGKALHVVKPLLDAAQLSGQLHASVQLPSFTDLVQNRLSKILAMREENTKERDRWTLARGRIHFFPKIKGYGKLSLVKAAHVSLNPFRLQAADDHHLQFIHSRLSRFLAT